MDNNKTIVLRIETDIILKLDNKIQLFSYLDTLYEYGNKLFVAFVINNSLLALLQQIKKIKQRGDLKQVTEEYNQLLSLLDVKFEFNQEKEWKELEILYSNFEGLNDNSSEKILGNIIHLFNMIWFHFIQKKEKCSILNVKEINNQNNNPPNKITISIIEKFNSNLFEETIELAHTLKASRFESVSFQYAIFTSPFLSSNIFSSLFNTPLSRNSDSLNNSFDNLNLGGNDNPLKTNDPLNNDNSLSSSPSIDNIKQSSSLSYTHLSHLSPTYDPFVVKFLNYDEAVELFNYPHPFISLQAIRKMKEIGAEMRLSIISPFLNSPSLSKEELKNSTTISNKKKKYERQPKAVVLNNKIIFISLKVKEETEFLKALPLFLLFFSEKEIPILSSSVSQNCVTLVVSSIFFPFNSPLRNLLHSSFLSPSIKLSIKNKYSLISLVGNKIKNIYHNLAHAFDFFQHHKIHFSSQPNKNLIQFIVSNNKAFSFLNEIHHSLFYDRPDDGLFGDTLSLFLGNFQHKQKKEKWWYNKKDLLLQLFNDNNNLNVLEEKGEKKFIPTSFATQNMTNIPSNDSFYVYDKETIKQNASTIKSELNGLNKIFFAIKANSNIEILKILHQEGIGFECVSPGELTLIRNLFPELEKDKILFTPNFASKKEFLFGFKMNVTVTVDNLYILENWSELFKGKDIMIRLDTEIGQGHHKHVQTAGKESKFGIALNLLDKVAKLAETIQTNVIGFHCHVGSGIFDPNSWYNNAKIMQKYIHLFPKLRIIDLGGGIGVDAEGRKDFDFKKLNSTLLKFKEENNGMIELWMEPGRYFVALSGIVLSKVTQLKEKSGVKWIGISTGFNTLVRPILYSAYHPIFNLTRIDEPFSYYAEIVGPICETGDVFGHSRKIQDTKEGDILLIEECGAYGYSMSSYYNLREPANEILI